MNYLNTKHIERQLRKIVKSEYSGEGQYAHLQEVNMFVCEGQTFTLTINYGTKSINKQVKLYLGSRKVSMDFLKGMFYQAILDNDLSDEGE